LSTHETRTKGELQRYTEIQIGRIAGRAEQLLNDLARSTQVPQGILTEAMVRVFCSQEGWTLFRPEDHLPEMRPEAPTGNRTVESLAMVEHARGSLPEGAAPDRRIKRYPGRPGPFKCVDCPPDAKTYRTLKTLGAHQMAKHGRITAMKPVTEGSRRGAAFPRLCRLCKKSLKSPMDTREHYRVFHPSDTKKK